MKLHILDSVREYVSKNPVRFHMPAHKADSEFTALFGMAESDVTELGAVKNELAVELAEKDVAEIFGVKRAVITSDGASLAIFSAAYAVKNSGKRLIINRSAHKSVYNALAVLGIEPIIIDEGNANGIAGLITPQAVEDALTGKDDVIGAFLTYPDYYGRTFDIEGVCRVIRNHGKRLLIDNAHGGHYAFTKEKPYAGDFADIFVISAHKVFSSLNQGAILLCADERLTDDAVAGAKIFSTSSPSYPILASVEYGVKKAYEERDKAGVFRDKIGALKKTLRKDGYDVLEGTDCFKLAIDFGDRAESAEKHFEKNGIFAEMNDGRRLLFMFSFATKDEELAAFYGVVKGLKPIKNHRGTTVISLPKRVTGYLDALSSETEDVELKAAKGRVSAVNAGLFPPCCPLIVAGERITEEIAEILGRHNVFGVENGRIRVIKDR